MARQSKKKNAYPEKRTMNLYYKPDRTTFPATVALYVLFALTLLLAFGKYFVYDILMKYEDTKVQLAQVEAEKSAYEEQLVNYDDVLHRYQMYSSTDEEDRQTDRMDVLRMLDEIVRPHADLETVSIADGLVSLRFSGVTLRETAEIVRELDNSPIVARTTVNTAATVENPTTGAGRTNGAQEQPESVAASDEQVQGEGADASNEQVQGEGADGSGEQAQGEGADGSGEQAQGESTDGSGEQAQTETAAGAAQPSVSVERKGNLVTANILIALKKESGEEEVQNETTTVEP